ncbi:MAG: phosphoglycerate dehydrogenase [Flavobacteriales bacterium]|nr:MAG: phosphoglycerate dehydrogenase [Flavobacteriales bacterium]
MRAPKVLLIDEFHTHVHQHLTAFGFEVFDYKDILASEVLSVISTIQPEGLLLRSKIRIDEIVLKAGGCLRWVGRGGAGMDNIDEQAADKLEVYCFNAGEANADAVGEHAMAMLLALFTKLLPAHTGVVNGQWDREENRGIELKGSTIGILGYGNTGSSVAQKLVGFGVKIIAHDKYLSGFSNGYVKEVSEQELLACSDILTLHVPLTADTQDWLNASRIAQISKPFWLLNLSRGGVVDIQAVLDGLNQGKILGFAADVLASEPPMKGTVLFQHCFLALTEKSNVVFSPHIAGWTVESHRKISEIIVDKVLKLYTIEREILKFTPRQ